MAEYKFYGKYKNVRTAAWNTFIEFGITALPVKVIPLAQKMGIKVISYEAGKDLIDFWGLRELCEKNDGFTILLDEQWYIFYNGKLLPRTRIRFTIAHELGHFILGHELKTVISGAGIVSYTEENIAEKKRKSPIESEADMFAMRLLAPACVLWGLEIIEADDIVVFAQKKLKKERHA